VIEGRIGTSKRKYRLDRIMTKLVATSRSVIGMAMFVMNAEKILRLPRLLFALFVSLYMAIFIQGVSGRGEGLVIDFWRILNAQSYLVSQPPADQAIGVARG
jgi:hypothetical protein